MDERKKKPSLSEILSGSKDLEHLKRSFSEAKPADDYGTPLPKGEYTLRILNGELFRSKKASTPGYKLTFAVIEGEHVGRLIWHDIWLSEAAISMAKRDLGKLGVTSIDQLEQPLPPGIRCRAKVAVRKDDDGTEWNRLETFEVVGIDPPESNPYAPPPVNQTSASVATIAKQLPNGVQPAVGEQINSESRGAT